MLPHTAREMLRSGALLAGFAMIGGAALAAAHVLTEDRILEQQRQTLIGRLSEIVPPARYDNELLADTLQLRAPEALGRDRPVTVWRARRGGQPVAVLLETVAPDGYNGDIELLVGVNADGRLAGVRVLSHRETPGLGDKIELTRSDWILQFAGRSLDDPPADWRVRQDGGRIDQFAGATITPRAVLAAVRRTLVYAGNNMDALFADPEPKP